MAIVNRVYSWTDVVQKDMRRRKTEMQDLFFMSCIKKKKLLPSAFNRPISLQHCSQIRYESVGTLTVHLPKCGMSKMLLDCDDGPMWPHEKASRRGGAFTHFTQMTIQFKLLKNGDL